VAATEVRIEITSDLARVAEVRRVARSVPALLAVDVDVDLLVLLTSELVTNAVRVDAGKVAAVFSRSPQGVRVEVHDQGCGTPVLRRPEVLEEGGRGLLIVDTAADSWGAVVHPEVGTTVWFELDAASVRWSTWRGGIPTYHAHPT
jgi:anti-sigma regulatory factor (Ser/Thr protein kinase)